MRLCGYHRVDCYSLVVLSLAQPPAESPKTGPYATQLSKIQGIPPLLTSFTAKGRLKALSSRSDLRHD